MLVQKTANCSMSLCERLDCDLRAKSPGSRRLATLNLVIRMDPIERCEDCLRGNHAGEIVSRCIPTPCFGTISPSIKVATVGLNPAFTEWKRSGTWKPRNLRLPTLADFHSTKRAGLRSDQIEAIRTKRREYFENHPHPYFGPMNSLLQSVDSTWS